jgi:hypothetical protein
VAMPPSERKAEKGEIRAERKQSFWNRKIEALSFGEDKFLFLIFGVFGDFCIFGLDFCWIWGILWGDERPQEMELSHGVNCTLERKTSLDGW